MDLLIRHYIKCISISENDKYILWKMKIKGTDDMEKFTLIKVWALIVLIIPLVGIYEIEFNSAPLMSINYSPDYNGAIFVYLAYLLIIYISYNLFRNVKIKFKSSKNINIPSYEKLAYLTLYINVILLFILFIPFKGYQLFQGMGKGQFRVSLGPFGSVAYIFLKYTTPLLLANLSISFKKSSGPGPKKRLLIFNFIVGLLISFMFGFKSTALIVILPSFAILFPNIKYYKIIFLAPLGFVYLIFTYYLFDAENNYRNLNNISDIANFLWQRATIAQGDMSWYIWELYKNNVLGHVNYLNMLLSIVGDKIMGIFGLSKNNPSEWMRYHYDNYLTYLAGYYDGGLSVGQSVVGTPFSEGLISFGFVGVIIFAIIVGLLLRLWLNTIRHNYNSNSLLSAACIVYFISIFVPWLSGGNIASLFHIAVFYGMAFSIVLVRSINIVATSPQRKKFK